MKKTRLFLLSLFLLLVAAANAQKPNLTIIGDISGLQKGDTITISTIDLPAFEDSVVSTIVVNDTAGFTYRAYIAHDQYFELTYKTNMGKELPADRSGKLFIAQPGDTLTLTGERETIYYSRLSGGIYDEPRLAEYLRVEDSLGAIRGGYARNMEMALAEKDTIAVRKWTEAFNNFYHINPGIERRNALEAKYRNANPQGTLFLLVERLPHLSYMPIEEAKRMYAQYSDEIKRSWYGRKTAKFMKEMEPLALGNPAPDFKLVTMDGDTITNDTFAGKYLLFYHWGLCPGSIQIDKYVCELHDRYKGKGLEVVGLTESVAVIKRLYESTLGSPDDAELNATLGNMLKHPWKEVELETNYPDNQKMADTYHITGWPFFVLLSPKGTLLARNFSVAFNEARRILEKELGNGQE